jgi:hypothetical protein
MRSEILQTQKAKRKLAQSARNKIAAGKKMNHLLPDG